MQHFSIEGDRAIVPFSDDEGPYVNLYKYPAGGFRSKSLRNFSKPLDAVVSRAPGSHTTARGEVRKASASSAHPPHKNPSILLRRITIAVNAGGELVDDSVVQGAPDEHVPVARVLIDNAGDHH